MIPLPDLLHGRDRAHPDMSEFENLLELAFLGHNETANVHDSLGRSPLEDSPWDPALFDGDVFLREFVDDSSGVRVGDRTFVAQPEFLHRVLSKPPVDLDTIRFRQAILRELESAPEVRGRVEGLYRDLVELLDLIKSAHTLRIADSVPHRLAVLAHTRNVIDGMVDGFADCTSGLNRIHDTGLAIRQTREYAILADLLSYEDNLAALRVSMRLGANGRIKRLQIEDFSEATENRFHKKPTQRWRDMFALYWRGYSLSSFELVNRVIVEVYSQIAASLAQILTLKGHLEVYLTSRSFAETCRQRGYDVCLAEVNDGGELILRRLFNPLLLRMEAPPVPCDVEDLEDESVTLVTGPNSGGKTRLLQGIGLAQVLAQSGLYVPAASATVPVRSGIFASVVQSDDAQQLEGRLGRELLRIRTLFENIQPRSMVLLDELCSGTNPSEAAEIVLVVMRLLGELAPRAFITTHFLDLARRLQEEGSMPYLRFLQVQMDGNHSSYQFEPGVASTSMAAETARRLGVDFGRLGQQIQERLERDGPATRTVADA